MSKTVVLEVECPFFPIRYKGFEYKADERGLFWLHDGQVGLIDHMLKFDKVSRGGPCKDPESYERKVPIKVPDIFPEDSRKVKWDFLHRYWPEVSQSISDQNLGNHIQTMQHMNDEQRRAYVKQVGG